MPLKKVAQHGRKGEGLLWASPLLSLVLPGLNHLGLPVPLCPFFGESSPTKIDYRKKVGTLILTSLYCRTSS